MAHRDPRVGSRRSSNESVTISFSWGGNWHPSNDNSPPSGPEPSRTALDVPINDNGTERNPKRQTVRWGVVVVAGTILSAGSLSYLPTAAVAPAANDNSPVRSAVRHTAPGIAPKFPEALAQVQFSEGPLDSTIARGEGSYNSYNRGVAGDAHGRKINFSRMSVGEIMRRQALGRGNANRLFAVGKYQVIPATMRAAVHRLGLGSNTKFGPQTQEKVFRDFLIAAKRWAVKAYITGQSESRINAQEALAAEFASVANPYTGRSDYGGVGGNAASVSATAVGVALDKERKSYRSAIASGMSHEEAWESLSGLPPGRHGGEPKR